MSEVELEDRPLLCIAEDAFANPDDRDTRVTASEIHEIANGSLRTWKRALDRKLNGSTFHGNKETKRGHDREPELIRLASKLDGVAILAPSKALYGYRENPLVAATPDGLGIHAGLGEFGAETKSRGKKWKREDVPPEAYDQCQAGMCVTGFDWWLYVWEVEGQPGIRHIWVARDDKRIAFLVRRATEFLAWREAGAPDAWGGVEVEDDGHLAGYLKAQRKEAAARKVKEAHGAALKRRAEELAVDEEQFRMPGTAAEMLFQRRPMAVTYDEARLLEEDPAMHSDLVEARAIIAEIEETAKREYPLLKPVAPIFRVTANESEAA